MMLVDIWFRCESEREETRPDSSPLHWYWAPG